MDNEMNYSFDAKFEGNILVVGRTGYGKTTFVQILEKNKMFGEIKEVTWLSKISLSREREKNIRSCFIDEQIDFKYPNAVEDFDDLLEFFQRRKAPCNENDLGKNIKLDRLIVMDDVSGLADLSETFANFLTVSIKFSLTSVYIFHTIYPTIGNWQMILAKTKIFNIFSGYMQASSIVKILSSFCNRYRYNYIPNGDLWINRLYPDLSNSSKKQCLTIVTRDVDDLGPAQFRT